MRRSDSELQPRNGHTLLVGVGARISGCEEQKEASLEDQQDNAREAIADRYEGPLHLELIAATKAKGEWLDRPELEVFEHAYRSKKYDVIVFDDLSRLIRGGDAVRLMEIGVDHGIRTISIADGIDTASDTWEEDSLTACAEAVAHVQRTSSRIKQKCMNRFCKYGKVAKRPIPGYIVPPDAETYDDWQKDDRWTDTIREGARRLRRTLNCSDCARFFIEAGFPRSKYAKGTWDGAAVREFYHNEILKGFPYRGKKHSVKTHSNGHRTSVTNPKGPKFYAAPHLAHLSPAEFDDLNAALAAHHARFRRGTQNGRDPRTGVSRKKTRALGQHARCWYCGRHYVWGGNGRTDNLMCCGSRERKCWHSMSFNGPLAARRIVAEITAQLDKLTGFDDQFAEMVKQAQARGTCDLDAQWDELQRHEQKLEGERANVKQAMREIGVSHLIRETLEEIEREAQELARMRSRLEQRQTERLVLHDSIPALRKHLQQQFEKFAIESFEFGDYVRQLVPECWVYLIRMCDGGHPLSRAKLKFNLAGDFPDHALVPGMAEILTFERTIDLFDEPLVRERCRSDILRCKAAEPAISEPEIRKRLKPRYCVKAITDALALQSLMDQQGRADPYDLVREPIDDCPKLRRHLHSQYRFQP
ncbi:MAG: recombinase family protein, partial [Pirellulales bacterium]|nr:recombinase family protein [Pirellulales bacterium]